MDQVVPSAAPRQEKLQFSFHLGHEDDGVVVDGVHQGFRERAHALGFRLPGRCKHVLQLGRRSRVQLRLLPGQPAKLGNPPCSLTVPSGQLLGEVRCAQ